ncbi:MAG: recombination mediator RecR [Dehalococcoidia bacterium]|jgi:recombination protein RecR|nr:recombination mediator RecR [Dehalococcoidia bacterium]
MTPLNNLQFMPPALNKLIESFRLLPGIGPKTAQKLAFSTLKMSTDQVKEISESLLDIKTQLIFCESCQNISENKNCNICMDENRDNSIICVVEEFMDVYVLEKSGAFKGKFHVLHGSISPANGIGPDEIRIKELINRVNNIPSIKEIVIATNLNLEGEATAMYINQVLSTKKDKLKITRLARGLPSGSDIEYADETTILHALGSRVNINESI